MTASVSVKRLLHTLIPFLVLVVMQKGILLLTGSAFPGGQTAADLLAFLPAAAVSAALFRVRTYDPDPEAGETVPPLDPRPFPVCLLHLLAAVAAMIGVMFAVFALMNAPAEAADSGLDRSFEPSLFSAVSLLLIHPVIEEALFRRAFYGELRLMNPIFGILAQAVMFALVHQTVDSMIYALGAGVILGILAERSGRLWPPVAAHICINLRSYLYVTALAPSPGVRQITDAVLVILGFAAFVTALLLRKKPEEDEGEAEA